MGKGQGWSCPGAPVAAVAQLGSSHQHQNTAAGREVSHAGEPLASVRNKEPKEHRKGCSRSAPASVGSLPVPAVIQEEERDGNGSSGTRAGEGVQPPGALCALSIQECTEQICGTQQPSLLKCFTSSFLQKILFLHQMSLIPVKMPSSWRGAVQVGGRVVSHRKLQQLSRLGDQLGILEDPQLPG